MHANTDFDADSDDIDCLFKPISDCIASPNLNMCIVFAVGGDTRKKSLEALNEGSNAVGESIGIHRAVYRLLGLALVALR